MNNFQNEWAILHSDIEKYARSSLLIKLFSIFIILLAIGYSVDERLVIAVIFILWLQDGIWTTFQKRLEARILFVEQALKNEADGECVAFQLYSQWALQRQGLIGLIKEYLFNAAKPTVAYPYALLVLLMLFFVYIGR